MPQLEKKLESDLTVDSKVVACRFPFPSWKADDVIGEGIDSVWVYKQNQAYDCRNSFVGTKYNDKINRSDFLKMKAQEYYLSLII